MKPLTPAAPRAIIMVGIPGAGKSTFAERFAKTFQAPYINLRVVQAKADLTPASSAQVVQLMLDELTKTNRTLVYEGFTDTKASRQALVKHFTAAGYQPLFIWVQTESAEAQRRATRKRPDGTPLSEQEFLSAIKRFNPPTAPEKAVVISGKHTYASQLKIVLKRLASEQRPESPTDEARPRSTRGIILR